MRAVPPRWKIRLEQKVFMRRTIPHRITTYADFGRSKNQFIIGKRKREDAMRAIYAFEILVIITALAWFFLWVAIQIKQRFFARPGKGDKSKDAPPAAIENEEKHDPPNPARS